MCEAHVMADIMLATEQHTVGILPDRVYHMNDAERSLVLAAPLQ